LSVINGIEIGFYKLELYVVDVNGFVVRDSDFAEYLAHRIHPGSPERLLMEPRDVQVLLRLIEGKQSSERYVPYPKLRNDLSPENARSAAQGSLHRLRSILGEDWVQRNIAGSSKTRFSAGGYVFIGPIEPLDAEGRGIPRIKPAVRNEVAAISRPRNSETYARDYASTGLSHRFIWIQLACVLYGLLYSVSFIYEVAEFGDQNRFKWWAVASCAGCWVIISSLFALRADRKLTNAGKTSGLVASVSIFIVSVGILLGVATLLLPEHPSNNIVINAYPPAVALMKDVVYDILLAIVYLLLPYHFVIAAQAEMEKNGPISISSLLSGNRAAATPAGAVFPRAWFLAGVLILIIVLSVILTNALFNKLIHEPQTNMFMFLIQLRNVVYLTFGGECLLWYFWALEDLKRACNMQGVESRAA